VLRRIGKTALAVHAAHRLASQFPDRQLFVSLHGHTPGQDPVDPADALAGLLSATGLDTRALPGDLAGRAALWRHRASLLACIQHAAAHGSRERAGVLKLAGLRDDMIGRVALFVISGVSAAGKSTVARLLAERFERGVCVPGDAIRAMIVSGRADVLPGAEAEPLRQLVLRYAGALSVAGVFLDGGFDVVVEDVIIGPVLAEFLSLVPVPEFHLVFLDPDAAAIERRERGRNRIAYGPGRWSVSGLQAVLREETDRIGLWLDTTGQSAEQTVEAILSGLDASRVRLPLSR
jgi:adenylylsulfate kinase-like enzyme